MYISHFEVYFSDLQRCISQTYILGGNSEGDVLARPQLGHHAHLPPATKYFEKSYLPIVELLIKIYINICLVVFFQEKWYFSFYPHLQGSIKSLQICLNVGLTRNISDLTWKWISLENIVFLWNIPPLLLWRLPGPQPGDHAQLYYCREKERDSTSGRSTSRMMKQRGDGKARRKFDKNLIHWSQFLARINIELCSWLW